MRLQLRSCNNLRLMSGCFLGCASLELWSVRLGEERKQCQSEGWSLGYIRVDANLISPILKHFEELVIGTLESCLSDRLRFSESFTSEFVARTGMCN